MHSRHAVLLPFTAVVLCLTPLGARATQLSNPDFSNGLSSWIQEAGTWAHNPGDGIPGPGGTAGTTSSGAGTASLTQCVDVSGVPGGTGLALRAWVITFGHSSLAEVEVDLFGGANCTAAALGSASDPMQTVPDAAWNLMYTTLDLPPAGAASARVRLQVTNAASGQLTRFDAVRLDRNLVTNGHFTTDLSGWVQNTGTWTRVADGLSTPPGAARAVAAADGSAYLSQCVSLNDYPGGYGYHALARGKSQTALNEVVLTLLYYDDDSCIGNNLGLSFLITQNTLLNSWETFATNLFPPPLQIVPPPGAQSVAVFIALDPGDANPGDVSFADDVAIVPSDYLFLDGFESGNTSAWSSVAP